jgi:hypothetical protein
VVFDFPGSVFELVVVSAEWFESAGLGAVGDGPRVLVVEI